VRVPIISRKIRPLVPSEIREGKDFGCIFLFIRGGNKCEDKGGDVTDAKGLSEMVGFSLDGMGRINTRYTTFLL